MQTIHKNAGIASEKSWKFTLVTDAIIINPGAYTHYSYAILDALKAISVPAYEVHISKIDEREPFRAISVTAPACVGQIYGLGFEGYLRAMDYVLEGGK